MENLALSFPSPKMVLGCSFNPKDGILNRTAFSFRSRQLYNRRRSYDISRPSVSIVSAVSSSTSQISNDRPAQITLKVEALQKQQIPCFASTTTSSGQTTSSIAVNPQLVARPPPSNVGSPLFWIGVGVGLSAFFSWAAGYLKKYAMQQAMKTMMGQMGSQNNQFNTAGFPSGSPFPFPTPSPMPSASPFSSPSPTKTVVSPSPASSPSGMTVDVSVTEVETSSSVDAIDDSKSDKPRKSAFQDVSPAETLQNSPFGSYEEATKTKSTGNTNSSNQVSQNGAASKSVFGASEGSPFTGNQSSAFSVEALEKMMEDPTVQKMVYPYLPEEMRNPTTFKWMLQNPTYRQQLQDMLNNMGGTPEWDNKVMDSMKNFDLSSPEVKQQFDQIGLTPEQVISKIMDNPDVAMAFQNPRVQQAIMECSQNPLSITKYQNDKEVMDVFNKISELFPEVTGSP
ncbi:protein TIC 40, chloroplastic [Impatiens glandulifera]|uniref:protein TIC 40, chloroplastic n=1 Tax=Impatiens glandulifera TaxID=253017 RepID=UPI001FB16C9A|nr:protein TIC 40, chloroplastic [Impatiens glandulifera]